VNGGFLAMTIIMVKSICVVKPGKIGVAASRTA
jgi:hypothetical protein